MAHQSFAKTVLAAVQEIAAKNNGEASCDAISTAVWMQTKAPHKRLLNTLCDLYRTKRIMRIRQGVYGPMVDEKQPDKREVMWRVFRMRRVVTVADLQEMAGVSPIYAKEWLELLSRRGVAVRITPATNQNNHPHSWRIINSDSAECPVDSDKAARLRDLRRKKKEAIHGRLDAIDTVLGEVRQLLNTMEEEK